MIGSDWQHEEAVTFLWFSNNVNQEDKKWLDKVSTKSRFKLSEKERIEALCIKVFGKFPTD